MCLFSIRQAGLTNIPIPWCVQDFSAPLAAKRDSLGSRLEPPGPPVRISQSSPTRVSRRCRGSFANSLWPVRTSSRYTELKPGAGLNCWTAKHSRVQAVFVATTDYTARVFAEHNQIDGTRVIPLALQDCGLDASEGQCPKDGLNVLSVGRLVASDAYKGFDTLIAAVHNARSAGAPITLTIVGGGDDLPRLRSQAASLGLNGAVRFAGSVPDSKLHEEFQAADVFALPSRGEGFGLVYLEAMRYSRPCIGGNHGGVPELIDDGVDGYLVEHGDVNQLSDRLLTLYRDPELRRSMGLNARKKVETRYLFPHMRDRWFAVLDSVRRNQSMS